MLSVHYDPAYRRSLAVNHPGAGTGRMLRPDDLGPASLDRLARQLVDAAAALPATAGSG